MTLTVVVKIVEAREGSMLHEYSPHPNEKTIPCRLFHVERYPVLVFLQSVAPNSLAGPRSGPLKICEPYLNSRED